MPVWIVVCPNCETENQVTKDSVTVECGVAECQCVCVNCKTEFTSQQEFWRWLGLEEGPIPAPGASSI